jgi:hypothetical protein
MDQLSGAMDAVAALKAFEIGTIVLLIAILMSVGLQVVRQRETQEAILARLDRLEGIEPTEDAQAPQYYDGRR